jgi:hypothetical protein
MSPASVNVVLLFALALVHSSRWQGTDAAPIFTWSSLKSLANTEGTTTVSLNCELCKVVSTVLELYLEEGENEEEIEKVIGEICTLLKIEDERVCNAAMVEFKV